MKKSKQQSNKGLSFLAKEMSPLSENAQYGLKGGFLALTESNRNLLGSTFHNNLCSNHLDCSSSKNSTVCVNENACENSDNVNTCTEL